MARQGEISQELSTRPFQGCLFSNSQRHEVRMTKITSAVCSLIFISFSVLLLAQGFPRIELFAGYSRLQSSHDPSAVELGSLLNFPRTSIDMQPRDGFDASATGNFNRWLGLTADVAGY